jgi:subtilisin family serine protease
MFTASSACLALAAAPHVAGAALLLKNAFPALTGTQIKNLLISSGTRLVQPYADRTIASGTVGGPGCSAAHASATRAC